MTYVLRLNSGHNPHSGSGVLAAEKYTCVCGRSYAKTGVSEDLMNECSLTVSINDEPCDALPACTQEAYYTDGCTRVSTG